jgi:hypothetical protein
MGDIANILGVQAKPILSQAQTAQAILAGPTPIANTTKKMKKPKGMSREVFDLMGPDGLIPAVETSKQVHSGFKDKRISATKGKWIWAPFKSSARSDGLEGYHWQKADVQVRICLIYVYICVCLCACFSCSLSSVCRHTP